MLPVRSIHHEPLKRTQTQNSNQSENIQCGYLEIKGHVTILITFRLPRWKLGKAE
jgi:hypothetical protein